MEKIPPQSQEAEKSVLGSMLMDKDAVINVAGFLRPEHFYEERHGDIFFAIVELFEAGQPIDVVTLSDKLKSHKKLKKIGGRTYLTDLVSFVPTSAHAEEYGYIVRDNALRRNLISAAATITNHAFNTEQEVSDALDQSEQLLFGIAQEGSRQSFVHIKDLLKSAYERAEKDDGSEAIGISTGFKDLDGLLGGFMKSDLVILAARPSVGKTSLALDFLRNCSVTTGKKAAFFSLEMGRDQIVDRLLGMQSQIPFWDIRNRKMDDDKMMRLVDTMGELSEAEIMIDDKPGQSIMEVRTKARRLKLERGLDIIFVDYLQLMRGNSRNRDNRTLEVQEISQGLKNLARELEIPVVALSQLSRNIEQRSGSGKRRPQLSDLRESGSIEQDADIVMFIDREETYNPDTERKGLGDLVVAKHRNGPTGNIELAWVKEIASFRNIYRDKGGAAGGAQKG
jgi:replicative DNA helicase